MEMLYQNLQIVFIIVESASVIVIVTVIQVEEAQAVEVQVDQQITVIQLSLIIMLVKHAVQNTMIIV